MDMGTFPWFAFSGVLGAIAESAPGEAERAQGENACEYFCALCGKSRGNQEGKSMFWLVFGYRSRFSLPASR